ncbi:DNA repair protein RecO [[Haemophilus] ducreyi]|uniref:DNA repair protein RecO n=1 Tax=Haemophilus ducreyi TaxID=730 RepID=UPI000656288E|nr:DNA repair protein RecO [[Haemophilus] ducreyi]AKO45729.1 DNA repair protein RecO [[Haemophilus] ducreyi]AKO47115.1 DNA repair protein RecO [[Haemophilus] ducreyi]AKO48477.1 DNA repair protein RecO [[Haemophilus] ducreyi]AKO49846.1 DNA repair protein RecO [[Haemophilus] ducreyi]ANF62445.1 DNA repair protein RecO [[Haemophilus] ducreyi]
MIEQWQRGFVLHRREYRETSLLVDFFTEQHGRITLLAKSAKRVRSPLKAVLQPFTPLLLRWSGKGDLKVLTKAEPAALTLPMHHTALYSGLYVNEILIRVLENQTAYTALFQHYLQCITQLATQPEKLQVTLRTFEFHLLKALGYGVNFSICAATGQPIDAGMYYQFSENKGFFASLLRNHYTFCGKDLLAFEKADFSDTDTLQAAKRFTRIALRPYLGSQPLKSRELFQAILPHKLKSS